MIFNIFLLSLGLVSAFNAKTLETDENLEHAHNSEQRHAAPYLTKVSPLGDIRLTEEQERAAIDFNRYQGNKWPHRRLIFWFDTRNYKFENWEIDLVRSSLREMNDRVGWGITKEWQNGDGGDWVNIIKGNGCWSHLGKTGGGQDLSLGKGCWNKATIQHEIMHALGFAHTHNRHDRKQHVEIIWDNISEDWRSQYQQVNNDFIDVGRYEHYSIMHYPMWSPSHYPKDAFVVPNHIDRNRVGGDDDNNRGLTDEDCRKIRTVYS